jgi:inositol oxygenase
LDEYNKQLEEKELGKPKAQFRNYINSAQQERVSKFYTEQHKNQTYEYVKDMEHKYLKLDKAEMGVWEALEYLSSLVDASDPDTDLSQLQHALQTAESIRKKYPDEEYDWFPLTGLIHDLGKIMALSPKMKEPQWAVVGDTFPIGCEFATSNVYNEFYDQNPDSINPSYNTKFGIYKEGIGLDNVHFSYGHDEYLYQVCIQNKSSLPEEALYIIRYHSFYPWHTHGSYTHLTNDKDKEMLKWVKLFQKFDLYSKLPEKPNVEELIPYYKGLINKYFPETLRW